MLAIITFLGVAFVLFYFVGRTGSNSKTRYLEYLMDNPGVYGLICFIPTLLAVTLLLFFRNRNYVIGYHFDDTSDTLLLKYRGLVNKELKDIRVLYNEIIIQDFNEKKFLFNQTYRGKSITVKSANLTLDFVTNNFIWEDQPREKIHFIQELERIKKLD
jgi:heme/copper-type cytochrome/quinol oxidase subunit 2